MDFKSWWDGEGMPLIIEIMIEEGMPRPLAMAMVRKYSDPMEAAFISIFTAGHAAGKDAKNKDLENRLDKLQEKLSSPKRGSFLPSFLEDTDGTMDAAFGLTATSTPQEKDFCINCAYPPSVEVLKAIQKYGMCCPNCGKFEAFPLPAST